MGSSKKRLTEENLDSYLSSLGFQFPITETDLKKFKKFNSDFEHELNGNEIDPEKMFIEVEKEEKQRFNETKEQTKKQSKNNYFKRVVLAGEIANQLHEEPTFGHIKFQKIVYLCEKVINLDVEKRYSKQVAGPFDNKFMHSIDLEFKKQKWFDVRQEGKFKKYVYSPLENIPMQNVYFNRYFEQYKEDISWIIDTFRKSKTNKVELVATIYACLEEFKKENEMFSKNRLFEKIYSWSDRKLQFSEKEISNMHQWMIESELTPEHFS